MENDKYQNFINQFAKAFNEVTNEIITNLNNVGITITKEKLLNDIISEMENQEKITCNKKEEKKVYNIKPTTNLDELPEKSKQNLIDYISTFNRWDKLLIAEIIKIFIDEEYYAVEVRTISSNFITKRFTETEFIELINKEPEEKDKIGHVFTKRKNYNITIY